MSKRAFTSVSLAALLAGCGGGGEGGGSPPIPVVGGPAPPVSAPAPAPAPPPVTSASITYLHNFGLGDGDGYQPNGPPLQASDGNFYGTTRNGGSHICDPTGFSRPCGVIYRMTPSGQMTVLYAFGQTPKDGFSAQTALIQASDNALYGTTSFGGEHGRGTVFRITLDGSYRVLHAFGGVEGEGMVPSGALVLGRDGNFYGTTSSGGSNRCPEIPSDGPNCGTLFRLTPDGVATTLHSFGRTATDGVLPNGPLVQTPDGAFYGTTHMGGVHGRGTIFRLGTDGSLTIVYSFGQTFQDPSSPQGPLVRGSDGALYGTTPSGGIGGQFGQGTVYRLGPDGRVSVVYRFGQNGGLSGVLDGSGPSAFLAVGSDGQLYGTTRGGGEKRGGTAFRLTNAGALTTLFAFGPLLAQPSDPEMGLIEGRDGALYGNTFYSDGLPGVSPRMGFGAMYKLTIR